VPRPGPRRTHPTAPKGHRAEPARRINRSDYLVRADRGRPWTGHILAATTLFTCQRANY
jgi:hypothetical protein